MGFSYTPNTPQPTTFPANDQPLMNANFQYLSAFGNKDHNLSGLSSNANDGYHKQVTFNTDHATTGFAGGVSVAYANTKNGASQLHFNNALGDIQLTTIKAGVPNIAINGCSFLPGGILIQWGQATVSNGSVVAFTPNFGAAPYIVNFTLRNTVTAAVFVSAISAANWTYGKPNAGSDNIFWTAIGLA